MCAQFIFVLLPARSETATAANPVIRCRCGMPVSLSFCRRSFPCWKVPGETALRRHLLRFVISRPVPKGSLAGLVRETHPEGAGQIAVPPSPSRIRYQLLCVRCGSWWPCTGFLRRRCRSNRCFAGTFSNYLLEFVISWFASEVALGGPAPVSCGEEADKCGFTPSPSRLWVC